MMCRMDLYVYNFDFMAKKVAVKAKKANKGVTVSKKAKKKPAAIKKTTLKLH